MEPNQARGLSPYEFKLGHLASRAARNMNSTFGEGTANERTMRRLVREIQVTIQVSKKNRGVTRLMPSIQLN